MTMVKASSLEGQSGQVIHSSVLLIVGIHTGEFMGIPPTGKKVVCRMATFDKVVDGKLVQSEVIMDVASLLVQLGVLQPPKGL